MNIGHKNLCYTSRVLIYTAKAPILEKKHIRIIIDKYYIIVYVMYITVFP